MAKRSDGSVGQVYTTYVHGCDEQKKGTEGIRFVIERSTDVGSKKQKWWIKVSHNSTGYEEESWLPIAYCPFCGEKFPTDEKVLGNLDTLPYPESDLKGGRNPIARNGCPATDKGVVYPLHDHGHKDKSGKKSLS